MLDQAGSQLYTEDTAYGSTFVLKDGENLTEEKAQQIVEQILQVCSSCLAGVCTPTMSV